MKTLAKHYSEKIHYKKMTDLQNINEVIERLSKGIAVIIEIENADEKILKTLRDLSTYGNSHYELKNGNIFVIDPNIKLKNIKENQ